MDLEIELDRKSSIPLKRQLYEEIRRLILTGKWAPGHKLPSSRILSEQLSISRPIITWAFDQLVNEGYLQTFAGSGSYVSRELPEELLHVRSDNIEIGQDCATALSLSRMGTYLHDQGKLGDQLGNRIVGNAGPFEIDFRESPPSLAQFPMAQWKKLLVKHCGSDKAVMNLLQDARGYHPLRQAISEYLFKTRALSCKPEQILIVGGAQQALNLIARVHIDPGDNVALDDPSYSGVRYVFQSYGAQMWPIPVDESGLDVDTLAAFESVKFKLAYSMPTHQIPLGATLSLPRRLKLIDWAQTTGTMIVEDYYDGDYRYEGRPIPALAALDKAGWVLYVGTFSKILFPSLRIGYVVVPERLIEIYAWAKKLDDNYSPMLEQAVLADFMNSGSLDKYMRQMCKTYKNKRLRLIQALEANFGESIQILGESAGLSLAVRFQTKLEDAVIITELANLGVGIAPTSKNYMAENYTKGEFFMGFGNIDEHLIEEGVKRMARVIIAPSH